MSMRATVAETGGKLTIVGGWEYTIEDDVPLG